MGILPGPNDALILVLSTAPMATRGRTGIPAKKGVFPHNPPEGRAPASPTLGVPARRRLIRRDRLRNKQQRKESIAATGQFCEPPERTIAKAKGVLR